MKKLLCIIIVAITAAAVIIGRPQTDKDNIFRLHIIANSDSDEDQSVKLKVRDAILEYEKLLFAENEIHTAGETRELLQENAKSICKITKKVLRKNGKKYNVKLSVGTYMFPDRTYRDITYPAGEYNALRVVLGDGKGENWWCVMFPPLCIIDDSDVKNSNITADIGVEFKSVFGGIGKWFADLFNIGL